jgi:hypothetical protein
MTFIPTLGKRSIRFFCTLTPVLFLAACATDTPAPQEAPRPVTRINTVPKVIAAPDPLQSELRQIADMQDRLYKVSAPLLVNNAPLCRNFARNLLGFVAKTKFSYSAEFINASKNTLGLGDQLQITGVLAGSGADNAGVRTGDLLAAIAGNPLPAGADAERQAAFMLAPLVRTGRPINLTVKHNGQTVNLTVPLTRACSFGIELGNIDSVNAYADGRRVLITAGMMKAAKTPDELSYVIAREMAHDTLLHPARQRLTSTLSAIIDNLLRPRPDLSGMNGLAGLRPYPQNLDISADRLALYFVARAGYNIDGAAAFWQRIADENAPVSTMNGYTALHPSTSARLAVINATVAEIKGKQAAGTALTP